MKLLTVWVTLLPGISVRRVVTSMGGMGTSGGVVGTVVELALEAEGGPVDAVPLQGLGQPLEVVRVLEPRHDAGVGTVEVAELI